MQTIKRDIYVTKNVLQAPIEVTEGTNSIAIEFDVRDYDIPASAAAVAYSLSTSSMEEPNKALADVSGNKITIIPSEAFFLPGQNVMQVRIIDGNSKLISFNIIVKCTGKMRFGDEDEAQQSTLIEQMLAKLGEYQKKSASPYNFKGSCLSSALPASGNTVNDTYYCTDLKYRKTWNGSAWEQSSLNEADYEDELTKTNGKVSSLKEDIQKNYFINNEFFDRDKNDWEQGGYADSAPYNKLNINEANAVRIINAVSITKGLYKISNLKSSIKPYRIKIWVFDSSRKLIYNSDWKTKDFSFYVLRSGFTYIMHVGHTDGTTITTSELPFIFNDFIFWKISDIEHIDERWEYLTINPDGTTTYSNTRMSMLNIPLEYDHMYRISVSDNYRCYITTMTENKEVYEVHNYANSNVIQTRHVANHMRVLIKNIVADGEFNLDEVNLQIEDLGIEHSPRTNILANNKFILWKNASLDSNGNEKINEFSYQRALSSYIKIFGDTVLEIKTPSNYTVELAFYDYNKNYVGTYIEYVGFNKSVKTNGCEGYVRVIIKNVDSSQIDISNAPYGITIAEKMFISTNYRKNTELTVMTHNVGKFGFGTDSGYNKDDYKNKLLEWQNQLIKLSPDVLGLQEFIPYFSQNDDTISSRRDLLNFAFAKTIGGALEECISLNTNVISSKIGVLGASDRLTERPFMHVVFEKNNIIINFINVHLHPNNLQARKIQRKDLIQYLNNLNNVICTGDFNADTADEFNDFKSAGFKCANTNAYFGTLSTFIYGNKPLDNIIVSNNILFKTVETHDNITSDHYPLTARLIILDK